MNYLKTILLLALLCTAGSGYSLSITKTISRLKQECSSVKSKYGTRDLSFQFESLIGAQSTSETKLKMTDATGCVSNSSEYVFHMKRINGPAMTVTIHAKSLGGSVYKITPLGNECSDVAYPYFKQKLENAGVVWDAEIAQDLSTNLSTKYCPAFLKAARDQLITVLKNL